MSQKDINFVNSLYGVVNEKESSKINFLFFIIVILISILILWSNTSKIDELTVANGKVIPSSKIQKEQYFDGGIVSKILVKEGDHVLLNQDLMYIDTTRIKATFEETKESLSFLEAKKLRFEKELKISYSKKYKELVYSRELLESSFDFVENQKSIFKNNFYERQNSIKILRLQEKQKKVELKEIKAQVSRLKSEITLIKEEYSTINRMVKNGTKSKIELLKIKKEYNTLKGDLKAAELSIPRSKLSIEESSVQIKEKTQSIKSSILEKLQETISDINKINSRLISDNDKLEKTIIKSPVNGIIKQININTIGSVVKSGIDILEIVPDSDILYIEAKIDPKDIAFINPTLKAIVKLTAYDFSIYGGLEASIIEISADSIKDTDSKDNKSYYKLLVKTNKNYLEYNGKKLPIIPGMIASVDIVTGKKTIMDFILKPILKVKDGSFHER